MSPIDNFFNDLTASMFFLEVGIFVITALQIITILGALIHFTMVFLFSSKKRRKK